MKFSKITPRFYSGTDTVVFCTDSGYVKYLSVTLRSLINVVEKNEFLDVVIFTDSSLTFTQKITLKSLAQENISIRLFDVSPLVQTRFNSAKLQAKDYWSVSMWFKCFIPCLMPDYDSVLYCDCDLVFVKNPFTSLKKLNLKDFKLAAVIDTAVAQLPKYPHRARHLSLDLKLKYPQRYFNSGVMLFSPSNISLREYENELVRVTQNVTLMFPDQDFLNIVFNSSVILLPQTLNSQCNVLIYESDYLDWLNHREKRNFKRTLYSPTVVHYIGPCKPWNYDGVLYETVFWENARKSPYYEEILKIKLSQSKSLFRERIKKTFFFKFLSQVSRIFFPYGSNRRYKLKKILKL